MNKYLRNWMLGSDIECLRNIAIRSVRRKHAKRHGEHQRKVYTLLYPEDGHPRVLNGPFKGMHYLNETVWGSITPRWIGSYESCLWPVVEEIISHAYLRIIDVGCAEGYYAAGLCRALPGSEVFAYDLDPDSRKQALKLWELNGRPGRLVVGGLLDHAELRRIATPGTLLICDIEGGEMHLADPKACDALRAIDILIEVHQTEKKSVEENAATLRSRFESSHDVKTVDDSLRATNLEHVEALNESSLLKAMSEGRPYAQIWLWMKSRTR